MERSSFLGARELSLDGSILPLIPVETSCSSFVSTPPTPSGWKYEFVNVVCACCFWVDSVVLSQGDWHEPTSEWIITAQNPFQQSVPSHNSWTANTDHYHEWPWERIPVTPLKKNIRRINPSQARGIASFTDEAGATKHLIENYGDSSWSIHTLCRLFTQLHTNTPHTRREPNCRAGRFQALLDTPPFASSSNCDREPPHRLQESLRHSGAQ